MATRILETARKRPAGSRTVLRRRIRKHQPEYISKDEARELLDRQSMKLLDMSGAEFRRRYESGDLAGLDPDAVRKVAFILPMSDE